jgi:hypothetical protein
MRRELGLAPRDVLAAQARPAVAAALMVAVLLAALPVLRDLLAGNALGFVLSAVALGGVAHGLALLLVARRFLFDQFGAVQALLRGRAAAAGGPSPPGAHHQVMP